MPSRRQDAGLAGVIPGLMMGFSLMAMVALVARRENFARAPFAGWRAIWTSFRDGFPALMAPAILLGGMFSGLFTPTEAAAVATLYALLLGFVVYRTPRPSQLPDLLIDSAEATALVAVLVMAAGALGWCMSISRLPQSLIPILVAAAHSFAIDPTQFGLIMIFNLILGTIHPPVGVVLFVTSRVAGISFEARSRAVLPRLIPLLAVLALITIFPWFTLFLPNLLMPTN